MENEVRIEIECVNNQINDKIFGELNVFPNAIL